KHSRHEVTELYLQQTTVAWALAHVASSKETQASRARHGRTSIDYTSAQIGPDESDHVVDLLRSIRVVRRLGAVGRWPAEPRGLSRLHGYCDYCHCRRAFSQRA